MTTTVEDRMINSCTEPDCGKVFFQFFLDDTEEGSLGVTTCRLCGATEEDLEDGK